MHSKLLRGIDNLETGGEKYKSIKLQNYETNKQIYSLVVLQLLKAKVVTPLENLAQGMLHRTYNYNVQLI